MSDLLTAERRLFDAYDLPLQSRSVRLADPDLDVVVRETGAGDPVLFVHGSGMSGATWAPVLAECDGSRAIAVDLPGFGRSDTYEYGERSLRRHAVAQLVSLLDALELERATIVGTLGAMWALCLALEAPERVRAVVALGMPAAALPGLRGDPYFKVMTTPGLGRLVSRAPAPKSVAATRKGMAKVIGPRALAAAPDEFFDVVRLGMARPGWGRAMWTHLNLAMHRGRERPGNALSDDELRSITVPVQFVWGDGDVYGGPEIGRRATAVLPNARIEVIEGGHAPFLDDPALCARVTNGILR